MPKFLINKDVVSQVIYLIEAATPKEALDVMDARNATVLNEECTSKVVKVQRLNMATGMFESVTGDYSCYTSRATKPMITSAAPVADEPITELSKVLDEKDVSEFVDALNGKGSTAEDDYDDALDDDDDDDDDALDADADDDDDDDDDEVMEESSDYEEEEDDEDESYYDQAHSVERAIGLQRLSAQFARNINLMLDLDAFTLDLELHSMKPEDAHKDMYNWLKAREEFMYVPENELQAMTNMALKSVSIKETV